MAPPGAKAPSPLRFAGALHKATDDGTSMECGGNDAALAGRALGSTPPKSPSSETAEYGDLPAGWHHEQLDELCGLIRDQIQPSAAAGLPYVGLEHIDPGEPTLKRWGYPESVRSAKTRFAPGDILYGKLRPYLDKSVLAPFAGICSTDILVFRAQADRAIAEFLVSAIHTKPFLDHAISTTAGVNHPRTSWNALKVHALTVPPIPEQRAIAGVLRTVQAAKEACERVLAVTRQLKQSLLHHLFTYGPVPFAEAAHVPLKETAVGPTPEHWELSRLGEVATIERGKFTHRPRNDPLFYGGLIPFIQTGDVTKSGGRITAYTQTLNELGLSVSRIFPKGTIVLTIAANIGDTAILTFDSAFPDSLVGITPKRDHMECDYLLCFLQTQKAEMDRLAPRGTQKNINIRFLEPWPVLVPSLPEQRAIAAQLAAVDAKLAAEESRRSALAALFQSLLHYLMTGQVRVPLDCGGKRSATPLSPST